MSGLYILGTGVLAEEFFAIAVQAGVEVAGFVENLDRAKEGRLLCDRPILWVDRFPKGAACVCALSTTKRRYFIEQVKDRAKFIHLIHPSAVILPSTTLGEGTVVSAGVIIASHVTIGRHVFFNRGVRIGHHTRVGDYVTFQPGSNIGGLTEIGDSSYIGMGAVVIERLQVGREATVAAGAVVIHDVLDRVLVAGNPATIKKQNTESR